MRCASWDKPDSFIDMASVFDMFQQLKLKIYLQICSIQNIAAVDVGLVPKPPLDPYSVYLYYAERWKLHLESGPTLPKYASDTNISAASVRGKWSRFCSQACQDPGTLLMNLTGPDVKSWFDWIEENFSTYMNGVSKRMGLRRHPLPKPTAASDGLLHFLVTHMAHCDSVFADEKQRLYVLAGLNLSSISACRAVSLFDIRHTVNLQPDGRPLGTSGSKNPSNRTKNESSFNKSEDEAPSGGSSHTTGKDTEMSELEETDLDDIFSHHSDLKTASDFDCDSDASSVTVDGYLEGDVKTKTILWRHVEFYIVRNPTPEIVIEHEENLIFDLLGQLMALAIDNDIFLKINRDKLDIPIFRKPEHTAEGYRTSEIQPLKSPTWSGIIKLDFDTAAAFHKRPSNEIVQRDLRSATLLADHTAPIGLTDAQFRKISRDPEVRRLRRISRGLTARIRAMGLTIKDAAGTEAGEQKRRADAELNSMLACLRDKAKERNRKRHFRNTDAAIFNQQYKGTSKAASGDGQSQLPRYYHTSERAELVRLLCYSALAETPEDAHHRRLEYVRLLVRWQRRKESPRRGKQAAVSIQQMPTPTPPKAEIIPERYDPYNVLDRQKRKCKTNKLWDHVEKIHCRELAAFDTGNRRCGICSIRDIDFLPSSMK
ncbi:hypothetical protein ASPBRDRAFT_670028 [Aspergillus brasiliensis CBS 101740]|uniref:Uncharacterized protein n=1 Tax=Aspergillus brasiliensis (strain CBS 101740 / IMI 381727 / IBT 21946) TaxID=767769 RepID=A0A1L9U1V4_ASPBC|nr:hypothetical protein ASPBRDRAFT_670028 [Aspergillus brasiliensis CBS 101740]